MLNIPSLGLTQLSSILKQEHAGRVAAEIIYLNHDFALYMGVELYQRLASSGYHHYSGIGDWFFRQSAFPGAPDNADEYFARYYPPVNDYMRSFKALVLEKREGLDAFLDELISKYELHRADLVGFTSMFAQNVACIAMARKLKERNAGLVTVMGGANCEAPMGRALADEVESLDFVCSGPGLKSFPELVARHLDGEAETYRQIKGVFSKRGRPRDSVQADEIGEELDINTKIEHDYGPFLDALEDRFPEQRIDPVLLFETSRGCWWGQRAHCTFCGLNGQTMSYRAMSPELALELYKEMFDYAPRCSNFSCVDNIMPKNYLKEVFPFVDAPPDVSIFYEVKADLMADDLSVLSKARVNLIQPGIEALATSTLSLMKKGTTAFQNVSFLKNCSAFDVFPKWNLLVGFPGESTEVYEKYLRDIPLLKHLPPPQAVYPVRYDRYSPYFVKSREYGLDLHPMDYYPLTYPFGEEVLHTLAYYFADHSITVEHDVTINGWLNELRGAVATWQSRWGGETRAPQLFFKGEHRKVVYDSREGEAVEHRIGAVGAKVLEALAKPKSASTLASELGHLPRFDAEKELARLQECGLLFEEKGRFVSLVLTHEPPPMSFKGSITSS